MVNPTKLMAYAIALAVQFVLTVVWLAPAARGRWFAPALFGLLYFPGRYALQLFLTRKDLQSLERVHPEWPWRLPRTKSVQLTNARDVPWLECL